MLPAAWQGYCRCLHAMPVQQVFVFAELECSLNAACMSTATQLTVELVTNMESAAGRHDAQVKDTTRPSSQAREQLYACTANTQAHAESNSASQLGTAKRQKNELIKNGSN